jgi:hypothetical protein
MNAQHLVIDELRKERNQVRKEEEEFGRKKSGPCLGAGFTTSNAGG